MPVMTPDDLHAFLKEHFPQAPPGISVESVDDSDHPGAPEDA